MSSSPQRRVEKPWGHEIWWAHTAGYAAKLLYVRSGEELSLQMHRHKDETSYLLSGRLRLIRGPTPDDLVREEIGPGHSWRIEPGTVHSIRAIQEAVVLEVSTPELDDVVRLKDRYGR